MFFFICAWMNFWISNREAGDLRRHRAKYDVTVIKIYQVSKKYWKATLNWSDDFSITQHHQNILMSSFEDFVLTMTFTWNSDASEAFYCVTNYPSPATTKMKIKYNTQKVFFYEIYLTKIWRKIENQRILIGEFPPMNFCDKHTRIVPANQSVIIFSHLQYRRYLLKQHSFGLVIGTPFPLQRRHNEPDGVSSHRLYECLLSRLFRPRSKKTSKDPRHWPLWGEFTGDRWIPRTKGQ